MTSSSIPKCDQEVWPLSAFADEAGGSITQQIDALNDAGIKCIDPRGVEGHNITALPLEVAQRLSQSLQGAGIRVAMFGSPIGKIDIEDDFEIDLTRLRHLGRLRPVLGCSAVRIFSYYNKAGRPMDQWRAIALERLRALRELAGELGLVLYHENESEIFGESVENVLAIVRELRRGHAHQGGSFLTIFDFGNFNHRGDDVWQDWQALRDVTDAFHLKDNLKGQHVPPGQGGGKIGPILADAFARSWRGPLTLEPHLNHSAAVLATGPSGQPNQKLADLTTAQCFQVAALAARQLLNQAQSATN